VTFRVREDVVELSFAFEAKFLDVLNEKVVRLRQMIGTRNLGHKFSLALKAFVSILFPFFKLDACAFSFVSLVSVGSLKALLTFRTCHIVFPIFTSSHLFHKTFLSIVTSLFVLYHCVLCCVAFSAGRADGKCFFNIYKVQIRA